MAWLDAVPDSPVGKSTKLSRRKLIGPAESKVITPPIGPLAYILDAMMKIGLIEETAGPTGVFYRGLRWSEIVAWPGSRRLLPVELQAVKNASDAYAAMLNKAPNVEQPWEPDCE